MTRIPDDACVTQLKHASAHLWRRAWITVTLIVFMALLLFPVAGWLNGDGPYWPNFDSAFGIDSVVAFTQIVLAGAVYFQIVSARQSTDVAVEALGQNRRLLMWQAAESRSELRTQLAYDRLTDAGESLLLRCGQVFAQLRQMDGQLHAAAKEPGSHDLDTSWLRGEIAKFSTAYADVYSAVQIWQLHHGSIEVTNTAVSFTNTTAQLQRRVKQYFYDSKADRDTTRPEFDPSTEALDALLEAVKSATGLKLVATPLEVDDSLYA